VRFALVLTLSLTCFVQGALVQGVVQDPGVRRPTPLQPVAGCDLWTGLIPGNDPTAEATVQLCTHERSVAGLFLWSSLQAGWARRRFEGTWDAAHTVLTLRDTVMLERHPAPGWTLCMADRYTLRAVSPDRLEGDYASEACHDQGTLTLVRRGPVPVVAANEGPDASTTHDSPRTGPSRPAERGLLALRCSVGHAPLPSGTRRAALGTMVMLLGMGMRRRRGRRETQPEPRLARP